LNEPDVPVDGARVAAALTVLIETVQRYVSDAEAPSAERLRWESTMARAHAYDVGISKKVTGDAAAGAGSRRSSIEFRLGRAPVARWRFIEIPAVEQFT